MEVCSNWRFEKLILEPRNKMSYAMRSRKEFISRMWKSEELLESRNKGSQKKVCGILDEGSIRIKGFA